MTDYWSGLFRFFVLHIGLSPQEFWRLTLKEAEAMLAGLQATEGVPVLTRENLQTMMERFPDCAGTQASVSQQQGTNR